MAQSRGMRLVALVTMCAFVWLLVKIYQSPYEGQTGGKKLKEMTKDPNLERMATILLLIFFSNHLG